MRMRLIGLLGLMICGVVCAQEAPTTAPAEGPTASARQGPMRGGRVGPMSAEQQRATIEWGNENMPDLMQYALQYGRGRGRISILVLIRARMIALQEAPPNSALQERIRRNIATENQIGQHLVEIQTATPEKRAELQKKIEDAMRDNLDGLFAERQQRIDRLKARLEMEQAILNQDRQKIDQIMTRRLAPFSMALPEGESVRSPDPALGATPARPQE